MTDRDEIIAKIEKLPILQQIQLNLLISLEVCVMLDENRQKQQEEFGTNIPPEILEDIYQLHYKQGFGEYYKFISQLTGNLLETLLNPFEQLQLMGELAQAAQQNEQFKNLKILNQQGKALTLNDVELLSSSQRRLKQLIENNAQTSNSISANQ